MDGVVTLNTLELREWTFQTLWALRVNWYLHESGFVQFMTSHGCNCQCDYKKTVLMILSFKTMRVDVSICERFPSSKVRLCNTRTCPTWKFNLYVGHVQMVLKHWSRLGRLITFFRFLQKFVYYLNPVRASIFNSCFRSHSTLKQFILSNPNLRRAISIRMCYQLWSILRESKFQDKGISITNFSLLRAS